MNDDERWELPDGWAWTTIGEVATVNPPMSFPEGFTKKTPVSFVPMKAVDETKGAITSPQTRPIGEVWRGYKRFAEGDVIMAKITPCMENGKAAIADKLINGIGLGSTEFHVLRPSKIVLAKWVFYLIRQDTFRSAARINMAGTAGQLRVSTTFTQNYPFPLAPLAEQHRIVNTIEALFTQLEAGVAVLEQTQRLLSRYKASVLKAACDGQLVPQDPNDESASELLERILIERRAAWEAEQLAKMRARGKEPKNDKWKAKYKEPAEPDTTELTELPAGWVWANIGLLFEVTIGGTPSRKKSEYWDGNIAWVSSGEIIFSRIEKTKERITLDGLDNSNAKLHPKGTVLLAMIGQGKTRGRAAILGLEAATNQNIASILCAQTPIIPRWVFYWLMATYAETRHRGGGGMQKALNASRVRALPISLPPLAEQQRIVEEVERRLSIIAEAEAIIEANLKWAARLRQSILKRAFEGKLVPQDPNDEPASALLAQIKAERAQG